MPAREQRCGGEIALRTRREGDIALGLMRGSRRTGQFLGACGFARHRDGEQGKDRRSNQTPIHVRAVYEEVRSTRMSPDTVFRCKRTGRRSAWSDAGAGSGSVARPLRVEISASTRIPAGSPTRTSPEIERTAMSLPRAAADSDIATRRHDRHVAIAEVETKVSGCERRVEAADSAQRAVARDRRDMRVAGDVAARKVA